MAFVAARSLSPRERSLVAILILVAVVGLFWMAIIGPILSGFSDRSAQRALLTRQYQANQRIIGSIPRLRRQAEQQREQVRNIVVAAPTKAAALTSLQDRVQKTIENAGGEVRAVDDATNDEAAVRTRASARMTLGQLTTVLTRLENEPPYLAVESLDISADQAVISGRLDLMEVAFDVSVPVILSQSR